MKRTRLLHDGELTPVGYETREVAQILGLTQAQVRSYVKSGFLEPERVGGGGRLRFSFSDLVFLRTAKGLLAAGLPARRVRRSLSRLRAQLPAGRRLTGLRIAAHGDDVIVADGDGLWQAESGQALFDFGVAELARKVAPLARRAFQEASRDSEALTAADWFALGCDLEATAPEEAKQAYSRTVELAPSHADARVNLGRLLHESGDASAAESQYREALACDPTNATAAFNLGVALEDIGQARAALDAYASSLALDPENVDAHYNAAHLCVRLGETAAALRHLQQYRKLSRR
ncbi:MAG: tetratricopeptide repeat protein [Acidobacteriota bacterium]